MIILATLAALGRGERPEGDGVLGNARVEHGGGEAYGEEAALELFRTDPIEVTGGVLVEAALAAAWFGDGVALVADLYDGRIGRLWRVGESVGTALEPSLAVAFDPDLRQMRGDVYFRAEDHPALAPGAADAVIAAGNALVLRADHGPWHRSRAFVVRAFGDGVRSAALFALHRLSAGPVRSAGFVYAAALIEAGETRHVLDRPTGRGWTPRL